MKVAVIGAGVAGLGAAWLLSRQHDVVIYERESRFGGHACTVDAPGRGRSQPVDVGFIVFNERNYPNLVALFDHLGVPTKPSDMSFAVSLDGGRYEYGSSFAGFLAQRRNMVRPSFLRMTHDILRFNRLAPRLLDKCEDLDFTIGDFVDDAGLSAAFRDHYLMPMASCIWSTPLGRMLDYPAQTFVLATSVGGRREALTDAGVWRRFLGNPTMTLAVIVRIHWQALHLLCKQARFHRKPAPPAELVTR